MSWNEAHRYFTLKNTSLGSIDEQRAAQYLAAYYRSRGQFLALTPKIRIPKGREIDTPAFDGLVLSETLGPVANVQIKAIQGEFDPQTLRYHWHKVADMASKYNSPRAWLDLMYFTKRGEPRLRTSIDHKTKLELRDLLTTFGADGSKKRGTDLVLDLTAYHGAWIAPDTDSIQTSRSSFKTKSVYRIGVGGSHKFSIDPSAVDFEKYAPVTSLIILTTRQVLRVYRVSEYERGSKLEDLPTR